jgi:UMF1 family MFS transporter
LRGRLSWAFYDWANSPFTTIVITFVFPAYFAQGIVGDEVRGAALWGYAIGISGALIAVLGPIFGAIADEGGRRKPWLAAFTAICVLGSALLWFAEPSPAFALFALALVVIANLGFEFGVVFNNAMLPGLVAPSRVGRWSGWAWGLGYFGGLAALVVALLAFVQTETPLFGLDKGAAEHVRVVGPLVAVWFVLFVWPLFAFTPDRPSAGLAPGVAIGRGLRRLAGTLRNLRGHGNLVRFLIARMFYNDGLITIFAFGGIYAAGTFGMELAEVITFGIVLNVTAGLGALSFAWVDDWLGSRRTVLISLAGLLVTASGAILAPDVFWFWVWGSGLGIFVGPAQAASRSLMARLSPPELSTEFFGLYALSGKSTAFAGPILVAILTEAYASQRAGLATVLAFLAIGFALLLTVREAEPPG